MGAGEYCSQLGRYKPGLYMIFSFSKEEKKINFRMSVISFGGMKGRASAGMTLNQKEDNTFFGGNGNVDLNLGA
jgi:hypothetical protein